MWRQIFIGNSWQKTVEAFWLVRATVWSCRLLCPFSWLAAGLNFRLNSLTQSPNRKRKQWKRTTTRRVRSDYCCTSGNGCSCATGGLSGNQWMTLQTTETSAGVHLWAVCLLWLSVPLNRSASAALRCCRISLFSDCSHFKTKGVWEPSRAGMKHCSLF